MKTIITNGLLLLSVFSMCTFDAKGATDEEIKEALTIACTPQCGNGAHGSMAYVMSLCESNTNRLDRLMREVADCHIAAGHPLTAESAIRKIGRFGTTNSLPFLYSCVTNSIVGDAAIESIVCLNGIDDDTVGLIHHYLSENSADASPKAYCCRRIMNNPKVSFASETNKTNLFNCVYNYATNDNICARIHDKTLINFDPTFRYSKRRLAFLRTVHSLGLNDFQTHFVTNDINELVAYPESALGD